MVLSKGESGTTSGLATLWRIMGRQVFGKVVEASLDGAHGLPSLWVVMRKWELATGLLQGSTRGSLQWWRRRTSQLFGSAFVLCLGRTGSDGFIIGGFVFGVINMVDPGHGHGFFKCDFQWLFGGGHWRDLEGMVAVRRQNRTCLSCSRVGSSDVCTFQIHNHLESTDEPIRLYNLQ